MADSSHDDEDPECSASGSVSPSAHLYIKCCCEAIAGATQHEAGHHARIAADLRPYRGVQEEPHPYLSAAHRDMNMHVACPGRSLRGSKKFHTAFSVECRKCVTTIYFLHLQRPHLLAQKNMLSQERKERLRGSMKNNYKNSKREKKGG
ncbi:hypothetical protein NDU88_003270 [Pleurodeles waltl]|uniref:Uncharacterized protein n=1 Tax=Pleurodeles waltl TaxID=8319 RepID=A0AAV7TP73_PLEWA|nr:hypothetical protein NDU88_003270 [Pleurodeles waltl]